MNKSKWYKIIILKHNNHNNQIKMNNNLNKNKNKLKIRMNKLIIKLMRFLQKQM